MVPIRRIGFRIAIALAVLLLAVTPGCTQTPSHAQNATALATVSTGTISDNGGSLVYASSPVFTGTSTTAMFTGGTRSCWWSVSGSSGAAVQTCSGDLRDVNSSLETRKDDGKGPTLVQVKQTRHALKGDELAPVQYAALAKSVGLETPAEEATLLQALSDAKLNVYPFAKVDDYLYRQALKQGTRYRWVWKPVGKKGVDAVNQSGFAYGTHVQILGLVMAKSYTREIPVRVLTEMKSLLGCLPDAVFLVSDYEVVRPDPFLAVSTPALLAEGKIWIVDQWDEPGFVKKGQPVSVPAAAPAPSPLVAQR